MHSPVVNLHTSRQLSCGGMVTDETSLDRYFARKHNMYMYIQSSELWAVYGMGPNTI